MLASGISINSLEAWTFELLGSAEHPLYVQSWLLGCIHGGTNIVKYRFKQTSDLLKRTKRIRAQIIEAML
jgi:hypothetical protein